MDFRHSSCFFLCFSSTLDTYASRCYLLQQHENYLRFPVQSVEKHWRWESWPHCLYKISDITKLTSTSQGKLKNLFFFFNPTFYTICISSIYQNGTLYTGNMPSFIMWNWMPHDFSKCTSNIRLSGKLGPNNGKSLVKCIFTAGFCLA